MMSGSGSRLQWRMPLALLLLSVVLSHCSRDTHTAPLLAPYDDREKLGTVTASWSNTGEERAFAEAVRLKQPEVRFQYHVDADNRTDDKLFVRLAELELVDGEGTVLGKGSALAECTLSPGASSGVLAGDVWVATASADRVHGFRVARMAVPLGDKTVQHYRRWLLQGRPTAGMDIDTEIAHLAAAAACAR